MTAIYQVPSLPAGSAPSAPTLEPLICPAPENTPIVAEGNPLCTSSVGTIRVRVGAYAEDGTTFVPAVGVTVLAVLHTAAGLRLPLLTRPIPEALSAAGSSTVVSDVKLLQGAASSPSDADGIATFADLQFSVSGQEDAIPATHHRIAFCTAGTTGTRACHAPAQPPLVPTYTHALCKLHL